MNIPESTAVAFAYLRMNFVQVRLVPLLSITTWVMLVLLRIKKLLAATASDFLDSLSNTGGSSSLIVHPDAWEQMVHSRRLYVCVLIKV